MRRVSGILNGIAMPSGVVAYELRYDLGLLDEVLGDPATIYITPVWADLYAILVISSTSLI
jgi:hypothetical protein